MADDSSNSVAIVAIIILVVGALAIGYYFMKEGKLEVPASTTSNVEVKVPAATTTTTTTEKPAQ